MTRPPDQNRVIDPELLELFGSDPEALAVVHAMANTRIEMRRRPATRTWAVLAAALVALAIALGALTRESSHAGVIDSALAAVPSNRVINVKITDETPAGERIDLRSGRSSPVRHTIVEWLDPRTGQRRLRDEINGVAVTDELLSPSRRSNGFVDGALARFPTLYRNELLQAVNSRVSQGRLHGVRVYWIRFRTRGDLRSVAVDPKTYKPVGALFADGHAIRRFAIEGMTVLPAAALIPKPRLRPREATKQLTLSPSTSSQVAQQGLIGLSVLERLMGSPSRVFLGVAGDSAVGDYLFSTDHPRGVLPAQYVHVQEAATPQSSIGWTPPIIAMTRTPGTLFVVRNGANWTGFLSARGHAFQIASTRGRTELLRVARRLAATG